MDIAHDVEYSGPPTNINCRGRNLGFVWTNLRFDWVCGECGHKHQSVLRLTDNTWQGHNKKWRNCKKCYAEHMIDLNVDIVASIKVNYREHK